MDKKSFVTLIHCGRNPHLSERSLGDGWISSITKSITLVFDEITDLGTIIKLCEERKTFTCLGLGCEKTFVIQSFNFGTMGSQNNLKYEKSIERMSEAKNVYQKWLTNCELENQ